MIRDGHAVVANVADTVAVRIRLVGICAVRAVVAHVADAVVVGVRLRGVRCEAAVVAHVADSVAIGVALIEIGSRRAVVTDIADAVAVPVGLPAAKSVDQQVVGVQRAVAGRVAGVVRDQRVRARRAVVAGVAHAVAVRVGLGGVGDLRAVVAGVSNAVAVRIALARIRNGATIVAGVPDAVAVAVGLRRIGDRRAIILPVDDPVAVRVQRRVGNLDGRGARHGWGGGEFGDRQAHHQRRMGRRQMIRVLDHRARRRRAVGVVHVEDPLVSQVGIVVTLFIQRLGAVQLNAERNVVPRVGRLIQIRHVDHRCDRRQYLPTLNPHAQTVRRQAGGLEVEAIGVHGVSREAVHPVREAVGIGHGGGTRQP